MTAIDGVYWALALAIVIIAAALTWFVIRCAATVARVNRIIRDAGDEVPATAASVRKILGNAEQVTADVASASSVIRDGAATVRIVTERLQEAVKFLDENIFAKLAALAPLVVALGAWLGRLLGPKGEAAPPKEKGAEGE